VGKSSDTLFRLRNQSHFVLGTYTESEIISRIAAGKYRGDEEVSSAPFLTWQKLSSHPVFYDAFLKRLFINNYQASDKSFGNIEALPPSEQKSEEPNQATQQLPTQQNQPPNKFDDALEVEKLFNEVTNQSDLNSPPNEEIEEMFLQQVENPEHGNPLSEELPVELTKSGEKDLFFEESATSGELVTSNQSGRKRLLAVMVGLGLVILYQMGQSGPESNVTGLVNAPVGKPEFVPIEKTITPLNREQLVAAVVEEGIHFYDLNTPLHYQGALELFKEARQLNPEDPQLLGLQALSQAHLFSQDPNNNKIEAEIKEVIGRGRKSEPHLNAFYRSEALIEFYKKNNEAALEKIRFAIEADPSDIESQIIEAEFLNTLGDRVLAKSRIEAVLARNDKLVKAHSVAAQISLDIGDLDSAEKHSKLALQLNQVHADTHFILAETYQRKGLRGPAIAHLDLVTKLAPLATRPVLADAHFSIAKLLEEQGNVEESAKHNQLAYYFSGGSLPGLKQKLNQRVAGQDNLRQLAKEQEYDSNFYNLRADELINENQFILGLEYLQIVRLLNPEKPEPLIRVAEILERLTVSYEKLKRVEILYERAIRKDPNYLDGYLKLGIIETEQYNFDNAYGLLLKASSVIGLDDLNNFVARNCQDKVSFSSKAKDDYKVYLALGKHFFKRENYDCAATFLQQAQISSPVNSEVFYYFGRLSELYKSDEPQRVINYYYQAFTIDSSNYDAMAGWARAKTKIGDKKYVVKYLRALIEADPRNHALFWVLGETYAENQEYQRAITFYKKALDYNPRFSKGRISLARAMSATGQLYQAINEYSYAATSDRRNGIGFFEAAQLQTFDKKYVEAETLIKSLIDSTPNYPGSHRLLSQIYQFMNRKDEAIREMAKEVENNPQNTKFIIDLAEVYIRYQKYPEAIKQLSKVVNLPGEQKAPAFRADRTQAFLLMSRCLRALNQPESAEGSIKLALEIDREDPELHRELGYVYRDLQRFREGVKEFEYYLERKPAGVDAENLRGLIKKMVIEE